MFPSITCSYCSVTVSDWGLLSAQKAIPDQGFQESRCIISEQERQIKHVEQGQDQGWTAYLSKAGFSFSHSNMLASPPSKAPLPPGWTTVTQVPWPVSTKTPAPTGRNTEVHNRDQTLDLPLSSGPAGMVNPIALHSPPFAQGLDPSQSEQGIPHSAHASCMAPKELSRVKWLRITLQSQRDGRHHQAKIIKGEQTAQKACCSCHGNIFFLFNRCPRNTQTHHNLPHPQHPTGFHKSPVASKV